MIEDCQVGVTVLNYVGTTCSIIIIKVGIIFINYGLHWMQNLVSKYFSTSTLKVRVGVALWS